MSRCIAKPVHETPGRLEPYDVTLDGDALVDGTPAVLKIGVPGRDVRQEAMVLRLANGGGCAKLLGEDVSRQALLLERLGAPMYDLVADPVSRHNLLCEVAVRLWRPIGPDIDLPTGAKADGGAARPC